MTLPQSVSNPGSRFSFWPLLPARGEAAMTGDAASSHRSCPGFSSARSPVAFHDSKLRCAQAGADRVSPPGETRKTHFWHGLN